MSRIEYDLLCQEWPCLKLPAWGELNAQDKDRFERLPISKRDLLISTILGLKLSGSTVDEFGKIT